MTDPRFFPSIYGPRVSRLGHKSMEKNSVRYLQYGSKTRLIRGIYRHLSDLEADNSSSRLSHWSYKRMTPLFCFYESLIKESLSENREIAIVLLLPITKLGLVLNPKSLLKKQVL